MTCQTTPRSGAPFGLSWGASCADVRSRFLDIRPVSLTGQALAFRLEPVVEKLRAGGGFCPDALISGSDRADDEVVFAFSDDRLQMVRLCFGYGFGEIGQDPDSLSEQAMSAFARAEMHKVVFEFASRYGPPALLSEIPNRHGRMHVQGTAMFTMDDAGQIQLLFGHDGGSFLVGEVRYRMPVTDRSGL